MGEEIDFLGYFKDGTKSSELSMIVKDLNYKYGGRIGTRKSE